MLLAARKAFTVQTTPLDTEEKDYGQATVIAADGTALGHWALGGGVGFVSDSSERRGGHAKLCKTEPGIARGVVLCVCVWQLFSAGPHSGSEHLVRYYSSLCRKEGSSSCLLLLQYRAACPSSSCAPLCALCGRALQARTPRAS